MSLGQVLRFVVPGEVSDLGRYERFGAIIKDRVSGRIVRHVQEVGSLGLERLPIPGGNPLGLVMQAVQSAQLHKIQQSLNTIQTISTVGAVASVATLGVSVAGFAMVMNRLNRMDGKLDELLRQNDEVHAIASSLKLSFDLLAAAKLRAALEALSLALLSDDKERRRTMTQNAVSQLEQLRHYFSALLITKEFSSRTSEELVSLVDAEERLVAACQGELVGEFLMSDNERLLQERRQLQRALFAQIPWSTEKELHDIVLQADRRKRVELTISPEARVQKVKAAVQIRKESEARLDSTAELTKFLRSRGIDFDSYRAQIEQRARETGEQVVLIDTESDVALPR